MMMTTKEKVYLDDELKSHLINLWEEEVVLYNVDHEHYHNKIERLQALKRISSQMPVQISHVQVNSVMRSLRTCFLKQRRKEEGSKIPGREEIYRSQWKFYDELKFLLPYTKHVPTGCSMVRQTAPGERLDDTEFEAIEEKVHPAVPLDEYDDDADRADDNSTDLKKTEDNPSSALPTMRPSPPTMTLPPPKRRKSCSPNFVAQVSRALATSATKHRPDDDDAEVLFGKTMTLMAKQIKDDMSREMAKIECQQVMLKFRANNAAQGPSSSVGSTTLV